MSLRRLRSIIRKEVIQILRDRRTLITLISLPIMQLVLYGYLSNDVRHISTAVFDESRTPESRALLDAFVNTTFLEIRYYVTRADDVRRLLDGGDAKIGIWIPPDYAARLRSGRSAQVQVVVDGTQPTVARAMLALATAVGTNVSDQVIALQTKRLTGVQVLSLPIDVRARAWYNPALQNVIFIVPGVIAIILMQVTTLQGVSVIVRERERGTMEQLVVTPATSLEVILGKVIPLVALAYVQISITLLLASLWFHVPLKGNLLLLYLLSLAFFFSTLGMSTLVSTVARTFQQAVQMIQLILLPSLMLSGFVFPRESLPVPLQVVGAIFPLTYYIVVLRGILIKSVGLADLWRPILPMAGIGVAVFAVAINRFQKRID